MNFTNLALSTTGSNALSDATIYMSKNIHFNNINAYGNVGTAVSNETQAGFNIGRSWDVTISNSDIHDLKFGILFNNDSNMVFSGNSISNIREHGMDGISSNLTITNNVFSDIYPQGTDHPDGIIITTAGEAPSTPLSTNINISDNLFLRGNGQPFQGIYVKDDAGDLPFQNVTISNNDLAGTSYNGIMVQDGHNIAISNNIVAGFADQMSWIRLVQVNGVSLTSNQAQEYLYTNVTAMTQSQNVTGGAVSDSGRALAIAWLEANPQNVSALTPSVQALLDSSAQTILIGATANQALTGGLANAFIDGGAGNHTLTGGGGTDLFYFGTNIGHDVVTDFGAGGMHDMIDISAFLTAGLQPTETEVGASAVISFSNGASITLLNTALTDLHPATYGFIH